MIDQKMNELIGKGKILDFVNFDYYKLFINGRNKQIKILNSSI